MPPEKPWPADLPWQKGDVVFTKPLADYQLDVHNANRRFGVKGGVVDYFARPKGLVFAVQHDDDDSLGYYEARELDLLSRVPGPKRRLRVRARGNDLVVQQEGDPGTWTTIFAGPADCSFFEVILPAEDPLRFGTWAAVQAAEKGT